MNITDDAVENDGKCNIMFSCVGWTHDVSRTRCYTAANSWWRWHRHVQAHSERVNDLGTFKPVETRKRGWLLRLARAATSQWFWPSTCRWATHPKAFEFLCKSLSWALSLWWRRYWGGPRSSCRLQRAHLVVTALLRSPIPETSNVLFRCIWNYAEASSAIVSTAANEPKNFWKGCMITVDSYAWEVTNSARSRREEHTHIRSLNPIATKTCVRHWCPCSWIRLFSLSAS